MLYYSWNQLPECQKSDLDSYWNQYYVVKNISFQITKDETKQIAN